MAEWLPQEGFTIGTRVICPHCHGLGFRKIRWWIFEWKIKCAKAFVITSINVNMQEEIPQ